jgi:hypothetical protein
MRCAQLLFCTCLIDATSQNVLRITQISARMSSREIPVLMCEVRLQRFDRGVSCSYCEIDTSKRRDESGIELAIHDDKTCRRSETRNCAVHADYSDTRTKSFTSAVPLLKAASSSSLHVTVALHK